LIYLITSLILLFTNLIYIVEKPGSTYSFLTQAPTSSHCKSNILSSPANSIFNIYKSTFLNHNKSTIMNLFKRAWQNQHVFLINEEHERIKQVVRKHAKIVLYINQAGSGGCESQINTSIKRVLAFTVHTRNCHLR
jgi:hypothetical protein